MHALKSVSISCISAEKRHPTKALQYFATFTNPNGSLLLCFYNNLFNIGKILVCEKRYTILILTPSS
jgi:hypothetical protein